jgi:hypothetical protein
MVIVLYIDGKMYGFHLGTDLVEAKSIVEDKAPYYPNAALELRRDGRVVATYRDGRWS